MSSSRSQPQEPSSSSSLTSTASQQKNTSLKNKKRLWLGLRQARTELTDAKLMYFFGSKFEENKIYELDDAKDILQHSKFDFNRKTVLYLHGYVEKISDESIHLIVDSYLKRNDHNILILDWEKLADGNYFLDALQNMKELGPKMADIILNLFEHGLQNANFHLVGHSLGSQMSGLIGRTIKKKTKGNTRLLRISALDPAFPAFYPGIGVTAINKDDAEMVDVIHTDAWLYGGPFQTGTVDFWPNGGKSLQPGCPKRNFKLLSDNDLCSHRRSWRFWAESIAEKNTPCFHAVSAKSWDDFKKGRVAESEPVQMGIDCPMNVKGNHFLQTNGQIPFSRGLAGIKFENIVSDPVNVTETDLKVE